jgi:hypothetical protein
MATKSTGLGKMKQRPTSIRYARRRKTATGQEKWNVTLDGRQVTMVTSSTSVAAMDDAVHVYSGALKRLAKR